jgi:hypothetical protein
MRTTLLALALPLVAAGCRDCEDLGNIQPAGAIEPAVFEFGPLTLGSECQANLKVTNSGNVDLSVTGSELKNKIGAWQIVGVPSLVKLAGAEDLLLSYIAEGEVGAIEGAVIELQSDDPDDGGVLRAAVSAIITDLPAPTAKTSCTSVDVIASPCPSVSFGAVQLNGAGLVLPMTLINDGTANMNVTAAVIDGGNADFTVESITRGTTVIELPTVVLPGRSSDCGAPTGADNSITINVRYRPSALGADVDDLVVLTDGVAVDGVLGGTATVALAGEGSDTGILMNPDFLNFGTLGEGDSESIDVNVRNIGTNEASVNFSCIDLENDDACDAECTGDPADTALGGTLSCIVTTVDGGVSGKGFVLDPTDAQAGGNDERIISVTWAPVAGTTNIPAGAVLALHSNILGDRVFTSPIQGGSVGIIAASAGAGSECTDVGDVCVHATGTPGEENFATWAGEAVVRLTNIGEASVVITNVALDPANTISDDYTIVEPAETSIAPGAFLDITVAYDEVGPGADAAFSSSVTNLVVEHTGAGLITTIVLNVIPPT